MRRVILTVALILPACQFGDMLNSASQQVQIVQVINEDQKLEQFVYKLMKITNAKLSPLKQELTAQQMVRVAKKVFPIYEQRENFAVLVAIESGFNSNAKSSVGAVGLAQVMPRFAKDFGKLCQLTEFSENDITDPEINLTLGACLYRELLQNFSGNTTLALVAYNAGANSKAITEISELRNITNLETANYVTKFTYVHHLVADEAKKDETETTIQ